MCEFQVGRPSYNSSMEWPICNAMRRNTMWTPIMATSPKSGRTFTIFKHISFYYIYQDSQVSKEIKVNVWSSVRTRGCTQSPIWCWRSQKANMRKYPLSQEDLKRKQWHACERFLCLHCFAWNGFWLTPMFEVETSSVLKTTVNIEI